MAVPGSPSWGSERTQEPGSAMECVSGMWGVKAGLRRRLRGVGIYLQGASLAAQTTELRLDAQGSGQCSLFLCWGPLRPLALGGDLIRSFILAVSFPEERAPASIIYSIWSKRKWKEAGWLAAGRGWAVGASKWGADTVPCLSIISHLLRVPGVCEIAFGLFRKSTSRPRNRPSMGVGMGVPEPPSLLGCGRVCTVSHSIASPEDDLEIASSNSKGPSGSQPGKQGRIRSLLFSLVWLLALRVWSWGQYLQRHT